jgi:hypothetical protein
MENQKLSLRNMQILNYTSKIFLDLNFTNYKLILLIRYLLNNIR